MRLAYFGSPVDAVAPLRALVGAGHEVVAVVTQPDRRRGRGGALVPSAVSVAADELNLPVLTPARAGEVSAQLAAAQIDLGVVVAFGQLLPDSLLQVARGGFVNVHFSLLPRWRGAAPVERAILAGDRETGVCLMEVVKELDAGGVYARATVAIDPGDTAATLRKKLVVVGTDLLVTRIDTLVGTTPEPQQGEPTYAHKLTVEEFRIDPRRPAEELDRLVRAGSPKPGAWMLVDGRRVKLLRASFHTQRDGPNAAAGTIELDANLVTSNGALTLDEVQPEGKRSMAASAWLAGMRRAVVLDPIDA